jgi:hypothetical protein
MRNPMKLLYLASLAATHLVAQAPQEVPKIPRQPAIGVEKAIEPLPMKDGVPATIGLPVPTDQVMPRNRAVEHPEVLGAASEGILRQFADPEFVVFDTDSDGTIWAGGNTYKTAYSAASWRFLGRPAPDATTLQPIEFRLSSASIDGAPVDLAAPSLRRDDRRQSYDHGGLVETIDVSGKGVEQAFVFDRLPQRGEIRLQVAVTTSLAGENTPEGGVVFRGPFDTIGYSGAVAIDANGARIAAPTAFADGAITIRVPADFVASAALPLRIDPLITSLQVYPSTNDVGSPDIAWDETGQVWAVTFMRLFGGSDWDCYVQRVSIGNPMTLVGGLVTIDFTGDAWVYPRIANLNVYDVFMVVCQTRSGTNPTAIRGRLMANSGVLVTGQFLIASSSVDELRPDIGGDPISPPTYFTVVWEHAYSATDHDIYARQIDATGALRGTGPTVVQANTLNQSWPTISKSDGGSSAFSQRFVIVYQQTYSASDEDIYGSMLTWDGVFVPVNGSNTFVIDASGASDRFPVVSTPTLPGSNGARTILVVYERPSSNNGDIVGTCIDQAGTWLANGNITQLEQSPLRLGWPQSNPSVDSDGLRFTVAYHEVFNNNTTINDLDTRATVVARAGSSLFTEEAGVALGYSGDREFNVQIAGRYGALGAYSPNFNTANDHDGISGGGFAIDAFSFDAAAQGLFVTRTTACGTLTISASGQAVPGGTINLGQSPQPYISGFVLGSAISAPVGPCPGCTLGVDGFLSVGPFYTVNVPNDAALVGAQFSAQGFTFQPIGTGAPCIGQIQLSDTIDVTIG